MGLSLTQILFTVVAIVLAWRVIGFLERRQKTSSLRKQPPEAARQEAVELEPCTRCGTYVPRGEKCPHCSRKG